MVSYVYPNVSELNRGGRGGLASRWELARSAGCDCVEMPADFVKNKTEYARNMGIKLGKFRENLQYMSEYDELVTAAGGERAVAQAKATR